MEIFGDMDFEDLIFETDNEEFEIVESLRFQRRFLVAS